MMLSKEGCLSSRQTFYKFLKVSSELTAWDFLTWGEERFLEINPTIEKQLILLGEDIFYRSLMIGALGVILSSLYGCVDIRFLKSIYHLPLILDFLYFNNSNYRNNHLVRPKFENNLSDEEFYSLCRKHFNCVEHDFVFYIAREIALNKIGKDDEDSAGQSFSIGMIFQKLEKRTSLKIRFFDDSQWSFFKNNLFDGIFFILKNKSFYQEVG